VSSLSDNAIARLRSVAAWPEFESARYVAIEEIGRGGMGTVYRATDDLLGREVAIKIPNGFGSASVAGRLQTEAAALARLEHPGIVPIHDAGTLADGRLFYVMKLVRGRTLEANLPDLPGRSERLGIFERVCEPIAFAHSLGFVHRDLKPENIMLGTFGEVLVMDWGAALLTSSSKPTAGSEPALASRDVRHTEDGTAIGTRGFMAPEQMNAGETPIDARADVYGLGAVLYLILTGETPPERDPASRLTSRRDVPAALRAICIRAMASDPAERYQDVMALVGDVRRYRAGLAVDAHAETALERTMRFARTYRTAIVLVLAYLVMRVIVAVTAGR
jgi:eukaryotic-like serine/threonine-protein kinase